VEKTQTRPWDPAERLETEQDMAAYLNVALEEGDLGLIMATLGDIARARRMALVAQETGQGRESLYKSLSPNGNPEFATVLKVVRALGLRLHATAAPGAIGEQDIQSSARLQESSPI
jgi:probable addiction module antidote protein